MTQNLAITKLTDSDFELTLKRLYALKEIAPDLDETIEDEALYPTSYAFSKSLELLLDLHQELRESLARGFCSLESRGGINLIWNQEFDKEVRVHIPFDKECKQSILYWPGNDGKLIEELLLNITKICNLQIWPSTNQSINDI